MDNKFNETMKFEPPKESTKTVKEIVFSTFSSLEEKGYNPVNQIIGYILSGDPTYITSHKDARSIICNIERDELLEELLNFYLNNNK